MDKVCTGRCKELKDVDECFHQTSRVYFSKKEKKLVKYVYTHSKCKVCRNIEKKEKHAKKRITILNI